MDYLKKRTIASLMMSAAMSVPMASLAQEQEEENPAVGPLEELVVTGNFIPDEKRGSSEIANLVDADDFRQTGDSSIAAALQRVTGLSLFQGKFVFVRGLGERYSSATLDGSALPSPEPLRRVVPLDIFPTSLLEGALVQKTYSPEFSAEFGGGIIELRTKALPDEGFFETEISSGFNTTSSLKTGLSYWGSSSDWTGIDSGLRDIPVGIKTNTLLTGLTPVQLEAVGESIPNQWTIDYEDNLPDGGIKFALGDRYQFSKFDLGVLAAANYGLSFQNRFGSRRTFTTTNTGIEARDNIAPEVCENVDGVDNCGFRSTDMEVSLNGILSVGFEFGPAHTVKLTTLVLRKSQKRALIEQGEFASDPGEIRSFSRIEWIERQVWSNQISGIHDLELFSDVEPMTMEWRVAYAEADRQAPLRREFRYDYDSGNSEFRLSTRPDGNRTSWGGLDDESLDIGVDFLQPAFIADKNVDLKAGFAYLDKQRKSSFIRYGFDWPPGSHPELRTLIPEIVFGSVNVGPGGFELREFVDNSDFFNSSLENTQFYGGVDVQLTDKAQLAVGARYEKSTQFVQTVDRLTDDPVAVTLKGEHLLPAATLTYEFTDNMQLRVGFSQTLSRPDLRELASANFIDPVLDRVVRGNPFLQITEIDSYDARWEYYFAPGESVTIGGFRKEFKNPIERTFQILGEGPIRTFENAESAKLMGVEAEVEKILDVSGIIDTDWANTKEFYIKANVAYIDSEITLDPAKAGQATSLTRALQGQSDVLANFQIGYEDTENFSFATLTFNYTGKRIFDVGLFGVPDVIENPPIFVNFVYSYPFEIGSTPVELGFQVDNILNDNFLLTQGAEIAEEYGIGTTFSLSLKARF